VKAASNVSFEDITSFYAVSPKKVFDRHTATAFLLRLQNGYTLRTTSNNQMISSVEYFTRFTGYRAGLRTVDLYQHVSVKAPGTGIG
jgi:hypothetical protein